MQKWSFVHDLYVKSGIYNGHIIVLDDLIFSKMEDLHKVEKGVQSVKDLLSKVMSAHRSGSSSEELSTMVGNVSGIILEMRQNNRAMCIDIEKKKERAAKKRMHASGPGAETPTLSDLEQKYQALQYEKSRLEADIHYCKNFASQAVNKVKISLHFFENLLIK